MATVADFIFLDSKIIEDGDCSHEIKRRLLLERKAMTNLNSILSSRVITLPKKVCTVKAMVFPVVMYRCESWNIKKAECWRIDAFELWCWRRLLRVPWTARRSKQSILNKINPEYSLDGLWPFDTKSWLIWKEPDAGKDWRQKEKRAAEDEMVGWHHWLNGHKCEQTPGAREVQGSHKVAKCWTRMSDWTTTRFPESFKVTLSQGHPLLS